MKILIGMPAKDSWGGPAACEPPFVKALRKTGADVTEEIYVYGEKERRVSVFERIRRVVKTALRFRRILREKDFDIIHLNTAFDLKTLLRDCVSLRLMKPKNAKIFLKIHGSEADYLKDENFLVRALRNDLKKRVDGFGIFTAEEKNNFVAAGFDAKKLFFVKNAVTIADELPQNFERVQKGKNDVFKLLFVSRFVATKGLLETVRACEILKNKNYKFALSAVGDGDIRRQAESEVEKLNLQTQVEFTGYIAESEVTKYFLDADIFVFPTVHSEGFPMVLFKAVGAGLPIVTTKIRAAADYLREPENCLFCAAQPENIAGKIIELIESKETREKMSANNLAFGKSLDSETIAAEFLEIYGEIIKID